MEKHGETQFLARYEDSVLALRGALLLLHDVQPIGTGRSTAHFLGDMIAKHVQREFLVFLPSLTELLRGHLLMETGVDISFEVCCCCRAGPSRVVLGIGWSGMDLEIMFQCGFVCISTPLFSGDSGSKVLEVIFEAYQWSLLEQLMALMDYLHWHAFRIDPIYDALAEDLLATAVTPRLQFLLLRWHGGWWVIFSRNKRGSLEGIDRRNELKFRFRLCCNVLQDRFF